MLTGAMVHAAPATETTAGHALGKAMSQQERGRQLIERYPEKAALLVGAVFDSVVLVDGAAKRRARQESLRIGRLLRQMAPHLTAE